MAGSAVTRTARSTAARSPISRLNSSETIIPVPTVARFSGVTYPMKRFSGTKVVNVVCRAERLPSPSSATTSTV